MPKHDHRPFKSSVWGKIIRPVTASALVFGITSVTRQDTLQSVMLSVLVGGIVLVVEFLSDFEHSIESLRISQHKGLAGFSEATRLSDQVDRSPVSRAQVDFFLNQVGDLGSDTHPLLLDLVHAELRRLGLFIKQVHEAGRFGGPSQSGVEGPFSITYHGEDREWLLALTCVAKKSIDAISLSTIDAGVNNYDGGLWRSDLGHRYIELQRMAILRGLQVRRIFYFDNPMIPQDSVFQDVCARQRAIGVNVRTLEESILSPDLKNLVSDFIVFDGSLGYEMTSTVALADGHRPDRLTTYLSAKDEDRGLPADPGN